MTTVARFVDSIAAAPTLRFDLNTTDVRLQRKSCDFSPPPLKTRNGETLLRDGSPITASAYGNRVIGLTILFTHSTEAARATALNTLNRELDRATNILMWQPDGASAPVFFRTYRSPDYGLQVKQDRTGSWQITLALRAEPFAFGLMVDAGTFTVDNDPAAGTNPGHFDVTAVPGDVEAVAVYTFTVPVGAELFAPALARKTSGDPSTLQWAWQLEHTEWASGVDTSAASVNSAVMSGAGFNYRRTTFATNTAQATRLSYTNPMFPLLEDTTDAKRIARVGVYRVVVRVKQSVANDVIKVNMVTSDGAQRTATLTSSSTPQLADLGWITLSPGAVAFGPSGVAQGHAGNAISLQAQRVSGSGSLDWDYLRLIPADEALAISEQAAVDEDPIMFDGYNDVTHSLDATVSSSSPMGFAVSRPAGRRGTIPGLKPGTNRLFLYDRPGFDDTLGVDIAVHVYYWPRWLYVR